MPLFIDDREPDEVVRYIRRQNLAIEIKHIESGDYVFGEVAIERKAILDLITSVTSGDRHLWDQLDTMKRTYQIPILLIEGPINHKDRLLMGILTTVILFWKYQTIFSTDKEDTARWVVDLFTKYGVGKTGRIPPAAVKKQSTLRGMKLEMLQCIDGIGPIIAKRLMNSYPYLLSGEYSRKGLEKEFRKVKGLNKNSKELLLKVLCNG